MERESEEPYKDASVKFFVFPIIASWIVWLIIHKMFPLKLLLNVFSASNMIQSRWTTSLSTFTHDMIHSLYYLSYLYIQNGISYKIYRNGICKKRAAMFWWLLLGQKNGVKKYRERYGLRKEDAHDRVKWRLQI